jgi:hypothetical protein
MLALSAAYFARGAADQKAKSRSAAGNGLPTTALAAAVRAWQRCPRRTVPPAIARAGLPCLHWNSFAFDIGMAGVT